MTKEGLKCNPEGKPPSDEGGGFRRRRKTEGAIYKKRATARVAPTKFCGNANENTVGADIIRQQKGNPEGSLPRGEGGFSDNLLPEKTKEGLTGNPEGLSQFIRDYPSPVAFGDSPSSEGLEHSYIILTLSLHFQGNRVPGALC